MHSRSIIPSAFRAEAAPPRPPAEDALADFSTDHRVLLLSAMALAIGAIG